jgi:ATP-dependent exoDNAse (exonuclease V) beta subunit
VREEDAQVESDQSDVVKIMTVHKSKGLEFRVVILPDLARTFNLSEGGKFRYDPQLGLVPSFTEHEAWNPFGYAAQLSDQNKQKALEEERRKLYVAMTRARDYLLLVGTRATDKKKNPSFEDSRWFDWLSAAEVENWEEVNWVRAEGGAEAEDDAEHAESITTLATLGDLATSAASGTSAATAATAAPAGKSAVEVAATLELRQDPAPLHELFPLLGPIQPRPEETPGLTLSVSALLTYFTCPRQYYYKYALRLSELARPLEDTRQMTLFAEETAESAGDEHLPPAELEDTDAEHDPTVRGTLVHRVLELLRDPADLNPLLRRALAERKIVGEEAERWIPLLEADLLRYAKSDLFREVQAAAEQQSEMMFRLRIGRHAVTGVIDKLYKKPDGHAVVLDYKTNRISRQHLSRTARHYTPQLQIYTLVAEKLLGWHVDRAVLYFTALDAEAEVPVTAADLQAMQSRLQKACDHIARQDGEEGYPQTEETGVCGRCPYQLICREDVLS